MEILIASGILLTILMMGSDFFLGIHRGVLQAIKKNDHRTDLDLITLSLKKTLLRENQKFAFFGGTTQKFQDYLLARALWIFPGHCRDLSQKGCEQDIAFSYAAFDESTTPLLKALCSLPVGDLNSATPVPLLLDLSNPTFGVAEFDPHSLTAIVKNPQGSPSITSGVVKLKKGSPVAVMDPPYTTLWIITQDPHLFSVTYNTETARFEPSLPSDCIQNLNKTSNGNYELNRLLLIVLDPLVLSEVTGGLATNISLRERIFAIGAAPFRIFNPKFRSVGKIPASQSQPPSFQVGDCGLGANKLNCSQSTNTLKVEGIHRVQLYESYLYPLSPNPSKIFQIIGQFQDPDPKCKKNDFQCGVFALPFSQNPITTDLETPATMTSEVFTWYKHEHLSKLEWVLLGEKNEDTRIVIESQ